MNEHEQLNEEHLSQVSGGVTPRCEKCERKGNFPEDSYAHEYGGTLHEM